MGGLYQTHLTCLVMVAVIWAFTIPIVTLTRESTEAYDRLPATMHTSPVVTGGAVARHGEPCPPGMQDYFHVVEAALPPVCLCPEGHVESIFATSSSTVCSVIQVNQGCRSLPRDTHTIRLTVPGPSRPCFLPVEEVQVFTKVPAGLRVSSPYAPVEEGGCEAGKRLCNPGDAVHAFCWAIARPCPRTFDRYGGLTGYGAMERPRFAHTEAYKTEQVLQALRAPRSSKGGAGHPTLFGYEDFFPMDTGPDPRLGALPEGFSCNSWDHLCTHTLASEGFYDAYKGAVRASLGSDPATLHMETRWSTVFRDGETKAIAQPSSRAQAFACYLILLFSVNIVALVAMVHPSENLHLFMHSILLVYYLALVSVLFVMPTAAVDTRMTRLGGDMRDAYWKAHCADAFAKANMVLAPLAFVVYCCMVVHHWRSKYICCVQKETAAAVPV